MAHQLSQPMRQCIQHCSDCHNVCLETASHCLALGGKHAEAAHVTLLLNCAEICATSADFMLTGSELHGRTCAVCAEACERCADSCEQLGAGDETMRRCAEACRACAQSCRQMAA